MNGIGLIANRPPAGVRGCMWYVTDAGSERLTVDDNTTWLDCLYDNTYVSA